MALMLVATQPCLTVGVLGVSGCRDFVTIRPGDVVPSEEWALKHQARIASGRRSMSCCLLTNTRMLCTCSCVVEQEELQGEPQLMDQAQKGRLAARLKEIVAELNERADMSDDTNSDADFERLQYERDQIERFLKEASAREAAILGDARVIGDISKCEMVIGTFIIGRIVIPSVVASPWTSGMCKEPGRRGKRNTAVLASLVWRLFFQVSCSPAAITRRVREVTPHHAACGAQIYKPGFKPGLHASATGGDEDAHRASSAIGRVSSTMGLEGHEETKGTDGAESRQEKRSPSMAEPATRTPLRAPSRVRVFCLAEWPCSPAWGAVVALPPGLPSDVVYSAVHSRPAAPSLQVSRRYPRHAGWGHRGGARATGQRRIVG